MKKTVNHDDPSVLNEEFLEEYSREDSLRRYSKETAGNGIGYLLEHDYGEIYFGVIENQIPEVRLQKGIRLWEFGCGAGMNLIHLVSALERRGILVQYAVGSDFSEALIDVAKQEAKKYLTAEQNQKVRFCVASHENLLEEATKGLGVSKEDLVGSFDIMLGVNTIRYCHRMKKETEVATTISHLLADHGVCIVIDMNDKFPVFRSRLRDRLAQLRPLRRRRAAGAGTHVPELQPRPRDPGRRAGDPVHAPGGLGSARDSGHLSHAATGE